MTDDTGERPATILVVDDDPVVRRYATGNLRTEGYTVLEAENGPAALEVQRKFGVPLDLLITDYVMPGMDGRELARNLRVHCKDLSVLFISGHIEEDLVQSGVLEAAFREGGQFLQKPFDSGRLLRKVRAMLIAP